jgi:hypothetical protein
MGVGGQHHGGANRHDEINSRFFAILRTRLKMIETNFCRLDGEIPFRKTRYSGGEGRISLTLKTCLLLTFLESEDVHVSRRSKHI